MLKIQQLLLKPKLKQQLKPNYRFKIQPKPSKHKPQSYKIQPPYNNKLPQNNKPKFKLKLNYKHKLKLKLNFKLKLN